MPIADSPAWQTQYVKQLLLLLPVSHMFVCIWFRQISRQLPAQHPYVITDLSDEYVDVPYDGRQHYNIMETDTWHDDKKDK